MAVAAAVATAVAAAAAVSVVGIVVVARYCCYIAHFLYCFVSDLHIATRSFSVTIYMNKSKYIERSVDVR